MSTSILFYSAATILLLAAITNGDPAFGGANVCNKTIPVRRDKTVGEPIKYEIQYASICGIIPCTKTRVETKMDYKVKTTWEEMTVAVCCPGYAEATDRKCSPICLKPCNHGYCFAPGQCRCAPEPTETSPGFVGSACNRFTCLASDRWGAKCDRECNCPSNSYCSASTGKCICRTGWRGENCMEECDLSMNCEDVELPPIIEPDSNVIPDSSSRSQKLEALAPGALESENQSTSYDHRAFYTVNMAANLIFLALMFVGLVVYMRRRKANENNIYYEPSTNSGASSTYASDSYYSNGSNATSMANRPRMPTPPEAGFIGKNLSFDAATRYILLKDNSSAANKLPDVKVDSKVEAHLITSQEVSKQNLYSDNEKRETIAISKPVLDEHMLHVTTSDSSEAHYQVPKSPAIRNVTLDDVSSNDKEHDSSSIYEYPDQNLYEEIKPKSPYKKL